MTEMIPPAPAPAQSARTAVCTACWALPGRPCMLARPPGDHLADYQDAEPAGPVPRDQLAAGAAGIRRADLRPRSWLGWCRRRAKVGVLRPGGAVGKKPRRSPQDKITDVVPAEVDKVEGLVQLSRIDEQVA